VNREKASLYWVRIGKFSDLIYAILFCNRLRFGVRLLIIPNMKGWLKLCLGLVVIGAVLSVAGCSEDSGWNAGMNGVPMGSGANSASPAGNQAPPPGSGAVDYVPGQEFQ
jgi:hypothetical protein